MLRQTHPIFCKFRFKSMTGKGLNPLPVGSMRVDARQTP
jgi:hypothetical protein